MTTSAAPFDRAARPGDGALEAAVAARLDEIGRRIGAAAARAERSQHAVTLVAVSKGFDTPHLRAGLAAGQRDFGESRVQALEAKAEDLATAGVRWHFVGRLQRNKAQTAVRLAALIHSVDRPRLATEIAEHATALGRVQPVLVQVNVGDDPAKGGCAVEEARALVELVRERDGITCQGLMTVPPMGEDPRPHFRRLRELRDSLHADYPEVRHLSMGMSNDFEVAVEEGATIVRLGEAIFGPRPRP
jgi:PLP dependent protein